MRLSKLSLISLVVILSLVSYSAVTAQDGGQDGPYYIVKEGDSLWEIAARFGVTLEALQQENDIRDPGQVVTGARLVIPGLSGVFGQVDTIAVAYGETLRSLGRHYGISEATLGRLNRLVNPAELYAGANLIVPVEENPGPSYAGRAGLTSGQSLLELAILRHRDTWSLALENNLPGAWAGLPGDVFRLGGASQSDTPSGLPEAITRVQVDPLTMIQGGTTVVKVHRFAGALRLAILV